MSKQFFESSLRPTVCGIEAYMQSDNDAEVISVKLSLQPISPVDDAQK